MEEISDDRFHGMNDKHVFGDTIPSAKGVTVNTWNYPKVKSPYTVSIIRIKGHLTECSNITQQWINI